MTRRRQPEVDTDWRHRLDVGDQVEVLKWVEQSGLERVARIIATLTDATGKRGQPDKLETLLLLKMAHVKRHQQPDRPLHRIAIEAAEEAFLFRGNRPSKKSFVSKLEHDFRRWWPVLMRRADVTRLPSRDEIYRDQSRSKPSGEFRARARISELMPGWFDLYAALVADAKKLGPDKVKLVKALGRERAESLLDGALMLSEFAAVAFLQPSHGIKDRPNFYDLIKPELEKFRLARRARESKIGAGPLGY